MFRGIPFASAPEGSLRFMPPVTPVAWGNVKQTVEFAPVCPQQLPQIRNESIALQVMGQGRLKALQQIIPKLKNQSEDCLYLNVYAPIKGKNNTKIRLETYYVLFLISNKVLQYYRYIVDTIYFYILVQFLFISFLWNPLLTLISRLSITMANIYYHE